MAFIFNPNKKRGVFMIPSGATKSPTPTPPSFNNTYSLAFDGVDDYVDVGVISTFQSTANFSVSCWLKVPNLSASNFFIGTYTSGSNTIYAYITTGGEVVFNLNNTYQRLSGTGTPLLIDNWYNIVLVYDGTLGTSDSMLIYINGILRSGGVTAGIPATTGTNTGVTYLGGLGGWTSRFTGNLDEVSFFNISLTPSEITDIYNLGTPNDLSALTGLTNWYRNGDNGTWKSPQWLIPNNENKTKFSNYSFLYDGVNDYIDTGTNSLIGETTLTISAWFKSSDVDWQYLLGDNSIRINIKQSNGDTRISFTGSVDPFRGFGVPYSVGNWNNIILTFDGSLVQADRLKLYHNGVEINNINAGTPNTTLLLNTAANFMIGRAGSTSSNPWNGNIDEVAYWDSVEDASTIYNSGTPNDISSLSPVGYWRSEQSNFTDNWLVDNSALSNYSTRSFSFDGVDDEIQLSSPTIFTDFTLSFWYKQIGGAGSFEPVVGRDTITGGILTSIVFSSGLLHFKNRPGSWTALTTTAASNTEFKHYSITYNSSANELKGYCNGTLEVTTTPVFSGATGDEHSFNRIGSYFNAYYLHGYLDEISTFNTVKNATEVNALYNGGEPARIEGATSHWRMGEDATFNTNWNVPDQVGSSTGTSANMTISDLQGEAPNYTGGGLSNNMTIEDRVGDAPNSSNNAVSFNQVEADRKTDVPT